MKYAVASLGLLGLLLSSCTSYDKTQLLEIVELPVKSTKSYDWSWHNSSLRAHSQYIFYGANTSKERIARLGDYYYVTWYDHDPTQEITVHMYYTQSATGSKILAKTETIKAPREKTGKHKHLFFFNGAERAQRGDILSWKMDIYAGDTLLDSKQSYLWQ
ncbi:MAG: hypothetical protein R3Y56_01895 [Akkermansia sp.]